MITVKTYLISPRCSFSLCSLQSWAEVEGRRNLGYLYALQHGAQRILDLSSR